ncbi:DUF58 domain-containing protein [Microbacterium caowuchunii]|uniref:DUF58 domain-containing protein n=1 Tax=Microbacterium caowuchunii TaxID=2614638 RepID=UPI001EE7A98A|nr:DUF58 domain-containing protein [Microbacterium caowuchunii]
MSGDGPSRITRIGSTSTATSGTSTRTRTRYDTSRQTTVIVVGGIRFWRRLSRSVGRAAASVRGTVTPAGWLLVGAALVGLGAGLPLGWIEFVLAGVVAAVLLLCAAPFLFSARAYDVSLALARDRVVAGTEVAAHLRVENVGSGVALPGRVDIPIGAGLIDVPVPVLRKGGVFDEDLSVPALRRGVLEVGPARSVRGDPLGILRREVTWEDVHTLYVHPVTTSIPSTATGFVKDLEGNPSSQVVDSDISFHAIREYSPGDSQRHIHWKSTAKTGTLMVRQYEETRRSRMVIVLASGTEEYANDEEFELAVSAAASLGVRGIRDGRDVSVVVGGEVPEFARRSVRTSRELATVTARTLLDDLAGLDKTERVSPLGDVAGLAVEGHSDVSIGFLVCGSTPTLRMLQHAALAFPADVGVAALICDPTAEPGYRTIGATSVVTIGLLDDLRHILARSAKS